MYRLHVVYIIIVHIHWQGFVRFSDVIQTFRDYTGPAPAQVGTRLTTQTLYQLFNVARTLGACPRGLPIIRNYLHYGDDQFYVE